MRFPMEKILAINRIIAAPLAAVGAYVYTVWPSNSSGFLQTYRANYEIDRILINKPFQEPQEKEILLHLGLLPLKQKILKDLKIQTTDNPKAILFCSKRFHPAHFGSIDGYFSKGCLIDIPMYFNISTPQEFDNFKSQMFLAVPTRIPLQQPHPIEIDWDSDAGKLYEDALMLSDNAKMFALAFEVYRAKKQSLLDPVGLMRFITVFGGFLFVQGVYYYTKVIHLPVLTLGVTVLFCAYNGLKNFYDRRQDRKTIVAVAKLGPEYLEGGIEYYQKRVQGNKSARVLLGKDGAKVYTVTGNEVLPFYKFQPLVDNEKLKILHDIEKKSESEKA